MSRRTAFQNGPFSAPVPDHAVPFGRRQLSMVLVFAEQSEKRVECFPNQLQEICLYFTMHVACFTFERYTKHLHRSHRAPGGPSDWQTVRDTPYGDDHFSSPSRTGCTFAPSAWCSRKGAMFGLLSRKPDIGTASCMFFHLDYGATCVTNLLIFRCHSSAATIGTTFSLPSHGSLFRLSGIPKETSDISTVYNNI